MKPIVLLLLSAALLSGCATNRCRGDVGYQQAVSLTEAQVEGLKPGTSAGAMAVPAAPAQIVPYARQVQAANQSRPELECLDAPPAKS